MQIVWQPQPGPQKSLVDCPAPEIFYGGARGGGKTDGVLGKYAIKGETYGSGFNAVFFRKELPMLDDAIERAHQIFGGLGWKWQDQKKTYKSSNGARLRFRPLEKISDAEKYQGQNISDACVEEAGNYPSPKPIDRLNGVLRSVGGVPTQLILTGNPGGAGQQWIKQRYIDPYPGGNKVLVRELPNGAKHQYVFIPSKVQNNKLLVERDPGYINRLYLVGSEKLVNAWLEGDWNAIEGAYFGEWCNDHILEPFEIPSHWLRFISGDWGSAKPFSFGWWAIASEDYLSPSGWVPKGAMVRYREWYGCVPGQPNTGLKMTAEEVGKGLLERGCDVDYAVIDPATFAEDGGLSIQQRIRNGSKSSLRPAGIYFRRADNKRVGVRGAMGGWDQLRARLKGEDFGDPVGHRPMIYCFKTCVDSIRTIPALQHDDNRPEDLNSDMEDHAADDWRYASMSRPYIKAQLVTEKPRVSDAYGFDEPQENDWKLA